MEVLRASYAVNWKYFAEVALIINGATSVVYFTKLHMSLKYMVVCFRILLHILTQNAC